MIPEKNPRIIEEVRIVENLKTMVQTDLADALLVETVKRGPSGEKIKEFQSETGTREEALPGADSGLGDSNWAAPPVARTEANVEPSEIEVAVAKAEAAEEVSRTVREREAAQKKADKELKEEVKRHEEARLAAMREAEEVRRRKEEEERLERERNASLLSASHLLKSISSPSDRLEGIASFRNAAQYVGDVYIKKISRLLHDDVENVRLSAANAIGHSRPSCNPNPDPNLNSDWTGVIAKASLAAGRISEEYFREVVDRVAKRHPVNIETSKYLDSLEIL